MLSNKMEMEYNKQINREMYSAYLYLSMSAYCASIGFMGFSNWMKVQAEEEMFHAMKMYDYVIERGGEISLEIIDKPDAKWDNLLAVFQAVYKHEQFVTSCINNLMGFAMDEKDFASVSFLSWYVNEQIEEEASADELCKKIEYAFDDKNAMLLLNDQAATRVFVAPATNE